MLTNPKETVLGLFHDPWEAQDALLQLRDAGFADFEVGIMGGEQNTADEQSYVGEGVAAGAAVGAGAGLMWGVGVMTEALPALGSIVAGGALAAVLTSTVAGAAAVGLVGALIGMGVARKDAEVVQQEVEDGQTLVSVQAGSHADLAVAVLLQCGADSTERYSLETAENDFSLSNSREELIINPPCRREDQVAGSE